MPSYTIEKHWDGNECEREGANGRVYLSRGRWQWVVLADGDPVGSHDLRREAKAQVEILQARRPGEVYVVVTMGLHPVTRSVVVEDVEVLDAMPQWDWVALGQVVRVANVNGGDSAVVPMPAENRGR